MFLPSLAENLQIIVGGPGLPAGGGGGRQCLASVEGEAGRASAVLAWPLTRAEREIHPSVREGGPCLCAGNDAPHLRARITELVDSPCAGSERLLLPDPVQKPIAAQQEFTVAYGYRRCVENAVVSVHLVESQQFELGLGGQHIGAVLATHEVDLAIRQQRRGVDEAGVWFESLLVHDFAGVCFRGNTRCHLPWPSTNTRRDTRAMRHSTLL